MDACGVLIQHEMAYYSAKVGDVWGAYGCSWDACSACNGTSFGQGEGGGEVSDKDERENTMEPIEHTVMCPGHKHLLPNAAVFNMARSMLETVCLQEGKQREND